MAIGDAVTIGTVNTFGTITSPGFDPNTGLYADHAYVILGYSSAGFQLYNPWGHDQPDENLSWSQLQADCKCHTFVHAGFARVTFLPPTTRSSGLIGAGP